LPGIFTAAAREEIFNLQFFPRGEIFAFSPLHSNVRTISRFNR
jgi:hypothetical protein